MRKILTFSLLAIVAVCGCQKQESDYQVVDSKIFTATIEEDTDTKTSLNVQNILWKKGDQVSIFAGINSNHKYQVTDASDGKKNAELTKISGKGSLLKINTNVAFYPYNSTAKITQNVNDYQISKIVLPSTQYYAENSFGNGAFPMVAVTNSTSDLSLMFKNILGSVKIQLKGTATIQSISITGNNNEILCGDATVTASNGSVPSITLNDESSTIVTLDCGTGVQLNNTTATSFVIALPPMTMTGGFSVVITDIEGKEMEIKTAKSQTITRSDILKMPEVNYEGKTPVRPLTFTSNGSKTSVVLLKEGTPDDITLEYKLNNTTWKTYTIGTRIQLKDNETLSFQAGSGNNSKFSKGPNDYYYFDVYGNVAASGNIMSLIDKTMSSLTIPNEYAFCCLFLACSSLTTAPELPAINLANYCYYNMFLHCSSLTKAPALPATTLARSCYEHMFSCCTSLTTAPALPATTLVRSCYDGMFNDCESLTKAPELPSTTLADDCYRAMFWWCKSLTTAPELPATTLTSRCYDSMFAHCTSLTTVPGLPATTLAEDCYNYMFSYCTSLTKAPELPATTLANSCYCNMFFECSSLTSAPALPATTLATWCYDWMFGYCTSLTTAPELPATTLARSCYESMFGYCTSLTKAPALPATNLTESCCYQGMFFGCTSLTTAPELPATKLSQWCYQSMFYGCTSLTNAPKLPATSIIFNCYEKMFYGCTSLTKAPELPATSLFNYCYAGMFSGCTSLTKAPELPATTLAENCYDGMFTGCTKLNYVKALFTTIPSYSYTNDWLSGVSSTGTFVKSKDATWDVRGEDGIPTDWTVQTE